MKTPLTTAEHLSLDLKKELNKPKLTTIRQTYLVEKIKLVEEFMINKSKQKPYLISNIKQIL